MRLTYPVKEAFSTLQGEGRWTGHRAVFVRFAGCNVWTGRERDRERDAAKGCCATWCDTNFVGTDGQNGGTYSAEQLAHLVATLGGRHVVLTGGEPTLVVDSKLVDALHSVGMFVQMETNGSRPVAPNVNWVTLSPKPPMPVIEQRYDEVKCVYPAGFDPRDYERFAPSRYIQPLDANDKATNARQALDFVFANEGWALSLQTHKLLDIP